MRIKTGNMKDVIEFIEKTCDCTNEYNDKDGIIRFNGLRGIYITTWNNTLHFGGANVPTEELYKIVLNVNQNWFVKD